VLSRTWPRAIVVVSTRCRDSGSPTLSRSLKVFLVPAADPASVPASVSPPHGSCGFRRQYGGAVGGTCCGTRTEPRKAEAFRCPMLCTSAWEGSLLHLVRPARCRGHQGHLRRQAGVYWSGRGLWSGSCPQGRVVHSGSAVRIGTRSGLLPSVPCHLCPCSFSAGLGPPQLRRPWPMPGWRVPWAIRSAACRLLGKLSYPIPQGDSHVLVVPQS
jgi:hypothetical protein